MIKAPKNLSLAADPVRFPTLSSGETESTEKEGKAFFLRFRFRCSGRLNEEPELPPPPPPLYQSLGRLNLHHQHHQHHQHHLHHLHHQHHHHHLHDHNGFPPPPPSEEAEEAALTSPPSPVSSSYSELRRAVGPGSTTGSVVNYTPLSQVSAPADLPTSNDSITRLCTAVGQQVEPSKTQ